tara:strand:+ start:5519 stop:6616 length:1098 start_codon:yes stop_codon:yes gene_type:complete
MQTELINFNQFDMLQDDACEERIIAAKAILGKHVAILSHHYQRADVYKHADLTGDSLGLSRLASQVDAKYLVFCGVHFMAEVADILSKSTQISILPDLSAGCSMADMADQPKVKRVWHELSEILDPDEVITPVTYINSAANLKSFCGQHGGTVCTSSNALNILKWSLSRREKILFFPDQHLGRWSGYQLGVPENEIQVWDFDEPMGGLTERKIKEAKILLWKGHCSVHQMFQPQHIIRFRNKYPDGIVISHPECSFEVCKNSDYVGSTDFIINTIKKAKNNSRWLVGTELNLVSRIAEEFRPEKKIIQFMSPTVCMCSTMARIDPQHLAWTLENLVNGKIVNQIKVPENDAKYANLALQRMLEIS